MPYFRCEDLNFKGGIKHVVLTATGDGGAWVSAGLPQDCTEILLLMASMTGGYNGNVGCFISPVIGGPSYTSYKNSYADDLLPNGGINSAGHAGMGWSATEVKGFYFYASNTWTFHVLYR